MPDPNYDLQAAKQSAPELPCLPADPLGALLRSRKFWLAVFAVAQAIVLQFFPDVPDSLWQSVTALVGVLIAAIAYEDAAQWNQPPSN